MDVGDIVVSALSDGTFVARPGYFGDDATAEGHGDLFDRRGQAWLPIGCFLVRSRDRCVLVDAGMGPTESSAGDQDDPCRLFGGQLPVGLRALGVEREDVTDVVCTHLHPDHVGGSSKARTSAARVRTSQSSSLDACSRAAGSAGGRDAPPGAPPSLSRIAIALSDTFSASGGPTGRGARYCVGRLGLAPTASM